MDAIADLAERYSFRRNPGRSRAEISCCRTLRNVTYPSSGNSSKRTISRHRMSADLRHHRLPVSTIAASPMPARSARAGLSQRFKDHALARTIGRLHINISGCINACGHHHVGHVGISASRRMAKSSIRSRSAAGDNDAQLGALLVPRCVNDEVTNLIEDASPPMWSSAPSRRSCSSIRWRVSASSHSRSASMLFVKSGRIVEDNICGSRMRRRCRTPARAGLRCALSGRSGCVPCAPGSDRRGVANNRRSPSSRLISIASRPSRWCFPGFRDGRGYSQAASCAKRYGYEGELRATGQVLRDQFLLLLRAGFDSFDVTKEADAIALRTASGGSTCSISRPATAAAPRSAAALVVLETTLALRCRPANRVGPLSRRGEGWGEGVRKSSIDPNPSPHPSPNGRGSRACSLRGFKPTSASAHAL